MSQCYVPKTVWATPTGRPLNYPEPGSGAIYTRSSGRRVRTRSARNAAKAAVAVASASSAASLVYAAIAH